MPPCPDAVQALGSARISPSHKGPFPWRARKSPSSAADRSAARSPIWSALKELGDVVMFDIAEGLPQGKSAGPLPGRPGRGLRRQAQGHQRLCRHQGRRCGDRHRRRAAQARHEPRRSSRHQSESDGGGGRGHQGQCAERLRRSASPIRWMRWCGRCASSPACRTTWWSAWPACWTARASATSWPRR